MGDATRNQEWSQPARASDLADGRGASLGIFLME